MLATDWLRPAGCWIAALALAGFPLPPLHGAEPAPEGVTPRPAERPMKRARRAPPARAGEAAAPRRARRPIEAGGATAAPIDKPLFMRLSEPAGCAIDHQPRLVKALKAMQNTSQLMSLEVWGDTDAYRPYQSVYYFLRSPRAVYVNLFWIGPQDDVYVPFNALRIPANRDVSVDPSSIIVPPLGREQWVALATLEPMPVPCGASEATMLAMLSAIRALPHAVGRWEVRSATDVTPAP